ncbi:hypothetical protein D3C73_709960 [compost metagenome]
MATLPKELIRMRFLEIASADFFRRYLCCNRQNRDTRPVAVKQPIDQMQVTGTATPCADGEFAGDMSFRASGKGCSLFVASMNPLDIASFAQGFRQPVQAVADNSIDPFYASGVQDLGHYVGDFGLHYDTPSKMGSRRLHYPK